MHSMKIMPAITKFAAPVKHNMIKKMRIPVAAAVSGNLNLATSVSFEIKDLFKGISPQFSYTSTSIGDQVQHFFNVTLKTSLEALKKTQQ